MARHMTLHRKIHHYQHILQDYFIKHTAASCHRSNISNFHSGPICCQNAPTHWNSAVSAAEKVVGYPTSFMNLRFWLSDEMSNVAVNMRKLIGTRHPLMKTAKGLLFDNKDNMQTRGLVVLLISKAAGYPKEARQFPHHSLDESYSTELTQSQMLSNGNGILSTQRSLAEITEMINTAFVLHKGVMDIDLSDRKKPFDSETEDLLYGNKMALLSGDYLLAKASSSLSALGNTYVVETMASAISDLMESGFFFDDNVSGDDTVGKGDLDTWEKWAYKNGASLYAKSCQSALMLSEHPESVSNKAYEFGKYFGLLRQMKVDREDVQPSVGETRLSLYDLLTDTEVYELKENYTSLARDCLTVLPNIEASEALGNVVQALSDNIA